MKDFKEFKEMINPSKRSRYLIKIILILITLGILLVFISIYRLFELIKDFTPATIIIPLHYFEYITLLTLDFSILLIPTTISLNHIIKSFKDNKNKIFSLLEELIMLRYDISDILLEKEKTPLMIHPIIIRDIKHT